MEWNRFDSLRVVGEEMFRREIRAILEPILKTGFHQAVKWRLPDEIQQKQRRGIVIALNA